MREYRKYSYNTDIWSVGCVLYELITLEKYFDFIQSNKINLSEHKIKDISYSTTKLNKLLRMYLFK